MHVSICISLIFMINCGIAFFPFPWYNGFAKGATAPEGMNGHARHAQATLGNAKELPHSI